MIIKKLELHNFGVYAGTNIFNFSGKKPIVLIGGMNGRGKTTFLEAVLLGLYGSNSFAYRESHYKTYGQYLKSFVNVSDKTLNTYIDLTVCTDKDGKETYTIHREWTGRNIRTSESITVKKNGINNQFLTDNWTMFIENILPSGLSNFFFFDGEKIAELAVEDTSYQMKASIKMLLGISTLDTLRNDIKRINNKSSKNRISDKETEDVVTLKKKKDDAEQELILIDDELEELKNIKQSTEQRLEKLRNEYSSKGGEIVSQRQELFQKRSSLIAKIDAVKEQLIEDSASEIPLLLVEDLLKKIREKAEIEQGLRIKETAFHKILEFSKDYKGKNTSDAPAIERFIEYIIDNFEDKENKQQLSLSDVSLTKLKILLDTQLHETKRIINDRQLSIKSMAEEVDKLDNYLSVDIDEKTIVKIFKRIKELEQDLMELEVRIVRKAEERRICNGKVIAITSEFNKKVESFLKKIELNDDSDRILKYSQIAINIIDEYQIRLQKDKTIVVAETMTSCYKILANKKNLIEKIKMDPVTLDLLYYDKEGYEINKSSLSAGEKQLMVISLLWALAICSNKKLPVIIDTPLSRLDSSHRKALIRSYFPKASDQTIILSTDSEIDKKYYNIMKNDIGDEFTLIYDDNLKSTSISRGYFSEG